MVDADTCVAMMRGAAETGLPVTLREGPFHVARMRGLPVFSPLPPGEEPGVRGRGRGIALAVGRYPSSLTPNPSPTGRGASHLASEKCPCSLGLVCFRDESAGVMLFGRGRDNLHAGEDAPLDEVLPSIVERMPAGLRLIIAVMHSSSEDTGPAIAVVRSCRDGDIAAYPNTGDYGSGGGRDWTDSRTPEAFADSCEQWAAQGARIVGGCRGYGPEHIRAMSIRLARLQSDALS